MHSLLSALLEIPAVQRIRDRLSARSGTLAYGLSGALKHAVLAACYADAPRPMAIIVPSHERVAAWQEDLVSLLPDAPVLELPELDAMDVQADASGLERKARRMDTLGRLARREPAIVLAEAAAAVRRDMPLEDFRRMSLSIAPGEEHPLRELESRLAGLGYERTPEVECMGQFSVRGGILDVFAVNAVEPVRIELFDNEVDSIRAFDLATRRSTRSLERVLVFPLSSRGGEGTELFFSYLEGEGALVLDEPMRVREQVRAMAKENPEIRKNVFRWEELAAAAAGRPTLYVTLLLQQLHDAEPQESVGLSATGMTSFHRQMDIFRGEASRWLAQKQRTLVLLGDRQKAASLHDLLARSAIPSSELPEGKELSSRLLGLQVGRLSAGFELPAAHLVVVTEKDIFGQQKKRLPRPAAGQGERLSRFQDIKPGDYVVHANHGIGKYLGVETLEVGGVHKDYLHIKYGGDDKLFVPTDQVQLLQKYIGSEGETPRLSRMGGTEWAKAKAKAKASVEDIAHKLIDIYARRRKAEGFAFSPDDSSQREFEDAFPFEETEDQLQAVREIKADMERPKPMDRLLCGDVGFGKTEVAIRAAYKAAMDGKQVAVLVPTTVLAQQHYQTFTQRFLDFAPTVDVVCRFRTLKEQRATLQRVAEGKVDILIGTHAILNAGKVKFKDLGLLIVDEEQRFGVRQKDKIRGLAAGIDVLTLSATPIPRTLHMSLVGARDMSLIETPPPDRFPVQSYVVENNDAVIANAIKREIKRGGQVYFVYNRVESIDRMRLHLEELVPGLRIRTAHGQMSEAVLERAMMEFYEGEYDILLATSIVENGLDVANANTIIVYNADRFGLSQLYQMRGRVGRSHHMAFAYFVYQRDKVLTEQAEKRLQAMKEFAELGAGFKIAMRDLEIRGAGNLLGSQQHGHIASVGFAMYCRLLEEAVSALRDKKPIPVAPPEPAISIAVEAYIDGGYISDAMHKIEIYQRIAALRAEGEIRELLDELIDRFGEPTPCVMRLLDVARLKCYARRLRAKSVQEKQGALEITLEGDAPVRPEGMAGLGAAYGKSLQLLPQQNLVRIRTATKDGAKLLALALRALRVLLGEEDGAGAAKKEDMVRAQ